MIVIIPFGVPGSGKSFIWKLLKEKIATLPQEEWTCDQVSSDGIRGRLMKEVMEKEDIDRDAAYARTQKTGPSTYG